VESEVYSQYSSYYPDKVIMVQINRNN